MVTPISLIIDSMHYLGQNANHLTVYLDKKLSNIESIKLVYARMICTFYNITSEIGNNKYGIDGALVNWQYLIIPDGLYDLRNFNKEFMGQLSEMGVNRHSIRFNFQETTGKILIHFQKQGNRAIMIY
jgi:hypothetical protein